MYTVRLKKGEERRLLAGHPWVYANEVAAIEGKDKQGSIASVYAADGKFVGKGYINHLSKILVRLISRDQSETIDKEFFRRKIASADEMRRAMGYDDNYRVVFGEGDGLSGLVVDKYGDYLSVQFLCLGTDCRKQEIVEVLVERFRPKGIYERSDVAVREKEGLPLVKGVLYGSVPDTVTIVENGLKIGVSLAEGQKTGYFLDQKDNRAALKRYVKGKRVLDCFSNVGGFALNAAKHGASEVLALDISPAAVEAIAANARANGLEVQAEQCDVFDALRRFRAENRRFDVIVLDPPAFTKSKDTVKAALRGYRDVNAAAMRLLTEGGILVSCSCSQHVSPAMFLKMLSDAAASVGRAPVLLEYRFQGADHPCLAAGEETLYLKVAILRF